MSTEEAALSVPTSSVTSFEPRLELRSVVAISVSAMLGSGIFVLPGIAAGLTGPSVWLAYIAAGLCVLPAAVSKAELATAMPTSGGTYVYIERTFGPLIGTLLGLGLWLSMLLKSAFALDGFAAYLEVVATVPAKPTALAMLALIVVLNIVGIRRVGQAQIVIVLVSLLSLGAIVVAGLFSIEPSRFTPLFTGDFAGFASCVAFVFVSYAGVTKIAAVAEEVKNPARNLPAGILLSLLCGMVMYGLVVFTLVGNVPSAELTQDLRPIHTLTMRIGGTGFGVMAAIVGVLTMTAMANAGLLSASRFPFAMSRDGLLPALFHRLSERFVTPVRCIIVTGVVMALAILVFDVERIAKLASAFILMIFLIENLSVIVLRETAVQWYQPTYRSPLYPFTQLAGILCTLALLYFMGLFAALAGAAVAVPGALVYGFYGRGRTERLGVLGKLGRRQDLQPGLRRTEEVQAPVGGDAAALVALLGHERSPETLVEMGAALADHEHVRVLHVAEIPEQTLAEAIREDDAQTRSLRRRVVAMAEARDLTLDFEAVASRDVVKTVHERVGALQANWLVMEWRARSRGSFLFSLPLGWLTQRLTCNFAVFRDAGVRYIREILAYVEPGPHDALVASTADHLAEIYGARVTLGRWVADDTPLTMMQAQTDYLDQLRGLVIVPAECKLLRGPSESASLIAASAAYDLIVIGAPPEKRILGGLRGSLQDRLSERGACSILTLRTPRTRAHGDDTVDRRMAPSHSEFDLLDYLDERFVGVRLPLAKKDALFTRMAARFAERIPAIGAKECVAALWERERTQNTSVGEGVAMPHATVAEADGLHLGIYTLVEPMDYEAIDARGVDVLFVTLGPPSDRQTHLRVLGALSSLVLQTRLLEGLRAAGSEAELVEAVRAACRERAAQHARSER